MNNRDRFIVQGSLGDGQKGYWHSANGGEWHADRERAKVYKLRAVAERIAAEYGGEIVQLPSPAINSRCQSWALGALDDVSPDPEISEWRQQILCDGTEVAAAYAVDADEAARLGQQIVDAQRLLETRTQERDELRRLLRDHHEWIASAMRVLQPLQAGWMSPVTFEAAAAVLKESAD